MIYYNKIIDNFCTVFYNKFAEILSALDSKGLVHYFYVNNLEVYKNGKNKYC